MGKLIFRRLLALTVAILAAASTSAQESPSPTPALLPSAAAQETPAPTPASVVVPTPAPIVETIVFIRHGEKPANDAGQLSCRGLNRALALPDVLAAKFGRPDFLFAPLTTARTDHDGSAYSYVRPLMTIEPTAIRAGLPVDTRFAFDDLGSLQGELSAKAYQHATIFVAWEHHKLDELVKRMVTAFGGDEKDVPAWRSDDYDSIFVLRLCTESQGRKSITFVHDQEGLDGLSTDYPVLKKN